MSLPLLSLFALVLVIGLAVWTPVNLGALALVAAFVVGVLAGGESVDDVLAGFPVDLVVILVGVTYLFGIARVNGTVDWFVEAGFRAVRGRSAAVPWAFFVLSAVLCGVGAFPPAAAAILMPVGMSTAAMHGIRKTLVVVAVGMGATAGSFSPLGMLGVLTADVTARSGLPVDPLVLLLATMAFGLLVVAVASLPLRRAPRVPAGTAPGDDGVGVGGVDVRGVGVGGVDGGAGGTATLTRTRLDAQRTATLVGLAVVVVGSIGFGLDIGFLALTVAVVLNLGWPRSLRDAVGEVSWDIVLLIGGVLTLVGVLERNGTLAWAGDSVASMSWTVGAALLLCVIAAVASSLASTIGTLTALVPLAVPLVATGEVGAVGLVAALAISCSAVDVSPFSTGGAIAMANAAPDERRSIFRGLLAFAGLMIVVAPVLTWSVLVVPGVL